jgi:hypothetical protein
MPIRSIIYGTAMKWRTWTENFPDIYWQGDEDCLLVKIRWFQWTQGENKWSPTSPGLVSTVYMFNTISLGNNYANVMQTCLPLRFWHKAHDFLGYLTPLWLLSISLRFCNFESPYFHQKAVFITLPVFVSGIFFHQ